MMGTTPRIYHTFHQIENFLRLLLTKDPQGLNTISDIRYRINDKDGKRQHKRLEQLGKISLEDVFWQKRVAKTNGFRNHRKRTDEWCRTHKSDK